MKALLVLFCLWVNLPLFPFKNGAHRGDQVSIWSSYSPTQIAEEDYYAICNHQTDSPPHVRPDGWSGDLQAWKSNAMTPNILTETRYR